MIFENMTSDEASEHEKHSFDSAEWKGLYR